MRHVCIVGHTSAPENKNMPRRVKSTIAADDVVVGAKNVEMSNGKMVEVDMTGWRVDWTITRSEAAENYFFSPSGTSQDIEKYPGFTHIQRRCKRSTYTTTWKFVNKQPRTTRRSNKQRRPAPKRKIVPPKRTKQDNSIVLLDAVGTVADL